MADNLFFERLEGFGLTTVMARKNITAASLATALGIMPPAGPTCSKAGDMTFIGTGPDSWLAFRENGTNRWTEELRTKLDGLASVSDQSSGYVVYRLTGKQARPLLQRGAFIDFHPDVFLSGSVASTVIAHINVILWQVDDRPTYHIALFRSFAASFEHWLYETAQSLCPAFPTS